MSAQGVFTAAQGGRGQTVRPCPSWNREPLDLDPRYPNKDHERGYKTAKEENEIIGLILSGTHDHDELFERPGLSARAFNQRISKLSAAGVICDERKHEGYRGFMPYADAKQRECLAALLECGSIGKAAARLGVKFNAVVKTRDMAAKAAKAKGYTPPTGQWWDIAPL